MEAWMFSLWVEEMMRKEGGGGGDTHAAVEPKAFYFSPKHQLISITLIVCTSICCLEGLCAAACTFTLKVF